jgi:hypothetical protein
MGGLFPVKNAFIELVESKEGLMVGIFMMASSQVSVERHGGWSLKIKPEWKLTNRKATELHWVKVVREDNFAHLYSPFLNVDYFTVHSPKLHRV